MLISCDHVYSQRVFAAALGTLPYPLGADWHRTAARDYGVLDEEKGVATRSLFVLDPDGRVTFRIVGFNPREAGPYEELFAALQPG